MGFRPPGLLFLTSLLHVWHCAGGQGSYIIDTVGLTVEPRNTVQSGTVVRLRCRVSVSHSNIPHLIHSFQLTRDDVPIYSSSITKDTAVYEINPARAADSGNYECRVSVKDKSKTSASQKLDVTGLQIPTLHLNTESLYENEEFKATCSAPEEKGPLTFRFYQRFRSGEPEIIKQLSPGGNSSTTTLRLSHIGNCGLYCDYEINLVSGTRQSNRSREIPVLVKALHITPIMNVLPSSNVSEGDLIEVVCKVVNPPSNSEVFLTKDKAILKQANGSALTHRFTVREGDSGELVCKAEWGSVQKEATLPITVKELFSKPRLTVEPTDIFEGDQFNLTCSVSIYDFEKIDSKAMQFSIYKDKLRVAGASTHWTVARPSTNGNYTCKANYTSLKRTIVKESQARAVKAKVAVSVPVLAVEGGTLLLGKPFQLSCYSKRGTLPISYTLEVPRKPTEKKNVSMQGEKAVFNLPPFTERSDLKNILCHARNSQRKSPVTGTGQQLLYSTIIIEPVSKPQLTTDPRIEDISEGYNVTLVCSIQRGSPPINFTWYSETKGVLNSQTSSILKNSYSMHNVRGEHGGGYYCVSTNPAGQTQRSATIIIGVKMAGWKKGLIAVFCILFILAIIFILFFKKRLLKLKKRGTVALSVKSAGTKVERLSLTQAEFNEAANATPGMMGKSIWSEHVSGSESDDNSGTNTAEKPEPQYSEVQLRQADPNKVPVKQDTDTVYSEVRNSQQGVQMLPDGGRKAAGAYPSCQGKREGAPWTKMCPHTPQKVPVEYAELNHDTDHHSDPNNHGHHGTNDDHTDDNSVSVNSTVNGE